jgi:hypothetical protein
MEECNNPQFFPTFDDDCILLNTTKFSKPTYPEKRNLSILMGYSQVLVQSATMHLCWQEASRTADKTIHGKKI